MVGIIALGVCTIKLWAPTGVTGLQYCGASCIRLIPRLHDEAGSTSWLYERTTSARRAHDERSSCARRASSSSQLHRVNGVWVWTWLLLWILIAVIADNHRMSLLRS